MSIDVPSEKARAVIDALEHDMASTLATKQDTLLLKQDIALVRQEIVLVKSEIVLVKQELEHRIDLLESKLTMRLGSFLVVAIGLLFAALKLT